MRLTRVQVRDLGPIKSADIELSGLTVILGPANTGKSLLLRSIFLAHWLNVHRKPEAIQDVLGAQMANLLRNGSTRARVMFTFEDSEGSQNMEIEIDYYGEKVTWPRRDVALGNMIYLPPWRTEIVRAPGRLYRPLDSYIWGQLKKAQWILEASFVDAEYFLEEKLLRGKIEVSDGKVRYWSSVFGFRENIAYAPDSVASLAPICLAIRRLSRGDYLLIDAPDMFLHPQAQAWLAQFLTRVVRGGATVVTALHSDWVAGVLGNFVGLGNVAPEVRRELGYEASDYLEMSELSVYVLVPEEDGTSVAQKIEVERSGSVDALPTYYEYLDHYLQVAAELHNMLNPRLPNDGESTDR